MHISLHLFLSTAFLRYLFGFNGPTHLITQSFYLKRGLFNDHFPDGLFSITTLIINLRFLRPCSVLFILPIEISFITLWRSTKSWSSRLFLSLRFPVLVSLHGPKSLFEIFLSKTSDLIFSGLYEKP